MSKTAQRKRDAYSKGYRCGRYGLWNPEREYRFPVAVGDSFARGRADGIRDRFAELPRPSIFVRLVRWIKKRFCA